MQLDSELSTFYDIKLIPQLLVVFIVVAFFRVLSFFLEIFSLDEEEDEEEENEAEAEALIFFISFHRRRPSVHIERMPSLMPQNTSLPVQALLSIYLPMT
jgi:hypothetical protein